MEVEGTPEEQDMLVESATEQQVEPKAEEEEVPVELKPIQFTIYDKIKLAQGQHGLKHKDYLEYRQYCTRRLARIKHAMGVQNHRGKFKKLNIPSEKMDNESFLNIPLTEAERAWAYGMEMKHNNDTDSSTRRQHMTGRFRKAVKHAEKLYALCRERGTPSAEMEALSYVLWMRGTAATECEKWSEGSESLWECTRVLGTLAKNDPSKRTLYREFADLCVPSLRYCLHNLASKTSEEDVTKQIEASFKIEAGSTTMSAVVVDAKTTLAAMDKVLSWPIKPAPIATKPFLFDVAYSYSEAQAAAVERAKKGEVRTPASPATLQKIDDKKKGWLFGWLG